MGILRKTPPMLLKLPRVLSAILSFALLAAPLPAQAFALAPSAAEIERLYNEGDKKNSEGDFKGAAESWTRLLVLLPEEGANQATRENLLLNVLDAHINAYNRVVAPDGKKDIGNLQEGKKTYELYLTQYRAVYGSGRAISAAVQQKGDELDAALAKAEKEASAATEPKPGPQPEVKPDGGKPPIDPGPPVLPPERKKGLGLIIGGSVSAAAGLGMFGMLIGGAVLAKNSEHDYEVAQGRAINLCGSTDKGYTCSNPANQESYDGAIDDLEKADANGRKANTLEIAGGVVGAVLLGAGVAMIAIGAIRYNKSKGAGMVSAAPAFSPNFAGLAIRGRF